VCQFLRQAIKNLQPALEQRLAFCMHGTTRMAFGRCHRAGHAEEHLAKCFYGVGLVSLWLFHAGVEGNGGK